MTFLCPANGKFKMAGTKGTSLWIHPKAGVDPRRHDKNFVEFYQFGKVFDADKYLDEFDPHPYKSRYWYESIFFDFDENEEFKT